MPPAPEAVALLPMVLPALSVRRLQCRWQGRPADWTAVSSVTGRDAATGRLQMQALRCPRPVGGRNRHNVWTLLAGALDIAAGRRAWHGARPRTRSQWYALRPDWQLILADVPVGLLHSPLWTDDPFHHEEASAAADVFAAVQPGWAGPWFTPAAAKAMLRAG